jgi:superfamily II DNA or RNA helicase
MKRQCIYDSLLLLDASGGSWLRLEVFIEKYKKLFGSKAEDQTLRDVVYPVIGENGLDHCIPQYEVVSDDQKRYRIDFALMSAKNRVAVEVEGFSYHGEGKISEKEFIRQTERQNYLQSVGWKVVRLAYGQMLRDPSSCRAAIRKAIRDDDELFVQFNSKVLQPNDVQQECLRRLALERKSGRRKGLIVLPTGLGKTLLSVWDSKSVGMPILYVVHNNEILRQVRESFENVFSGCTMGFLNTYEKRLAEVDILFANISSISNPKNYMQFSKNHFKYIIIDEFHHSAAKSYLEVIHYFKPGYLLGLTATPERTDQQSILGLVDNNLVYLMDTEDAISQGYLSPFHYVGLRDNIDYSFIKHDGYRYDVKDLNQHLIIQRRDEAIIEEVKRRAGDRRGLAYCITIEHAERAAEHFTGGGIPSVAVHSNLDRIVRDRRIEDFKNGLYRLAFVVDIFNEGVDYPDVDLLLFMRPTESRIILTQQLGRGLRVFPGKKDVLALDFIGDFIGAERIPDYIKDSYFMHSEFPDKFDKPDRKSVV